MVCRQTSTNESEVFDCGLNPCCKKTTISPHQYDALPSSLRTDLYVSAASHLCEILMLFQGFIHLIVGHAVAAQAALTQLIHLGKHHKLGHVGHTDQLPVQLRGQAHRLWDLVAVC